MKRINPTTQKPFKRGDVRNDGFVFFNYTAKVKANGFFLERWLSPDALLKAKGQDKLDKKAKYVRKTDRKSPGFSDLAPRIQRTINQIKKCHNDQQQYGDMTEEDYVELLLGYELDLEELELAIEHAGPVCFDVKAVFRKIISS
jgi:hypothetical protein